MIAPAALQVVASASSLTRKQHCKIHLWAIFTVWHLLKTQSYFLLYAISPLILQLAVTKFCPKISPSPWWTAPTPDIFLAGFFIAVLQQLLKLVAIWLQNVNKRSAAEFAV